MATRVFQDEVTKADAPKQALPEVMVPSAKPLLVENPRQTEEKPIAQVNPNRVKDQTRVPVNKMDPKMYGNKLSPEVTEQFAIEAARAKVPEKQARQFLEEGRLAEAEEACYRALTLSPKVNGKSFNMNALQLLGDIRFAQGKYEEAIQTYNRAREHTRNLELDFSTALAYMKLNDMESARKYFNVNKYYDVRKYSKSRTQSAAEIRAEDVAQIPEDQTAKGFEANIYIARAGDKLSYAKTEEALEDYQKALQMFPHNERAMTRIAVLLRRLERYDESTKMWARVAAFGTGQTADNARFEVRQRVAPDKAEQMIRAARNSG